MEIKKESNEKISTRVSSLFKYIQELNKLKQKTILNVKEYKWQLWCSDLPDDTKNIKLVFQDRTEEENIVADDEQDNILLSVHKEDFEPCPSPSDILVEWLKDGWKDYRNNIEYYDEKTVKEIDDNTNNEIEKIIKLSDNISVLKEIEKWSKCREKWANNQKRIARNRDIFDKMYSEYYALKRDS